MQASKIQTILWWLFFAAYFASKYFVSGFTGFSWGYLLSVVVLCILTALLPWYGAKWIVSKMQGAGHIMTALVLPVALTTLGLSIFFLAFIAPNYPTIELANIIHRALMPGAAITVLLFLPDTINRLRGSNKTNETDA
ncbi:hypothetical protein [Kordiimonas aquimaris]|uniref:hypothetical protein n=1 Tax=Kordiimonas aquimaris TaxID=707591 RepID=UPI0021D29464|nr:hypothetical protein [Kordiimonas aquimaris]